MTGQKCADPSFGIKAGPLAILQLLAAQEPSFAKWDEKYKHYDVTIQTFPWYNGRQHGICLVLYRGYGNTSGPCLCLVVTEARITDDIVIEAWEAPYIHNLPTIEEQEAHVEAGANIQLHSFRQHQLYRVYAKLIDIMKEWYDR